jgi:hypothetical protein
MFGFIWGNKTNITEKTLEGYNVQIIPKPEVKIDKSQCIAITGSGKFYKGTFKNEAVSVKVISLLIYQIGG